MFFNWSRHRMLRKTIEETIFSVRLTNTPALQDALIEHLNALLVEERLMLCTPVDNDKPLDE